MLPGPEELEIICFTRIEPQNGGWSPSILTGYQSCLVHLSLSLSLSLSPFLTLHSSIVTCDLTRKHTTCKCAKEN